MLIISITGTMFFALFPYYLQCFLVYAQVDLLESSTQTESVTSTYDALLKAPMIISQAAIVGGVFNHLFLQRVLRSKIQPIYKSNNLQSLKRLFLLLVACSLTILVTASSLIYLQAINLSSELGLDIATTFTILISTPVGPVWILRIVTSSIIVVSSILYYILEKKKIKKTIEEDHYTYTNKQRKRNQHLPIVLLYIVISSGAISILSNSIVSHSAALSFLPSLAILIDWLHFMAVSIWVGGLFYISAILLVTIRSTTTNVTEPINEPYETNKIRYTYFLAVLLPYFSLIATMSLGIIGVSGLYMAWIHLHTPEALFDTMYGNILIIKLSAILPMVILGAYHQLRLHNNLVLVARIGKEGGKSNDNSTSAINPPGSSSNLLRGDDPFAKFSKTINIESFIGIAVLFITSFLTITSPPSTSMAENSNLNGSSPSENDMPSFDLFAILFISLSAAVMTGSVVYFVKSKREIKKTLECLHP